MPKCPSSVIGNSINPRRFIMSLQELHSNGKIHWPGDARIAVFLSFDFQGGEDVRPDKNGKMNHEEYTQAEYGPNTGIWRILRDRKSTRLNSSHRCISYAVFCLKKK